MPSPTEASAVVSANKRVPTVGESTRQGIVGFLLLTPSFSTK